MKTSELYQKIEEIFEELRLINHDIPIIVEGKNDEATLRELGINGIIIRLNTGHTLLNFCEEIARDYDEVIILMDWDIKGRHLFRRLKQHFKPTKVKTNDKYWHKLKKYCRKEIQEVEQLVKYKTSNKI